jgi:hypothetical protein
VVGSLSQYTSQSSANVHVLFMSTPAYSHNMTFRATQ